jgi:ribonuclease BN (tRNA processing enzyme)
MREFRLALRAAEVPARLGVSERASWHREAGQKAVPSAALRFSSAHQTVAFSSDTGACDALIEAASNADLFLCEATYLAASAAELERHGHLTPELAAATASRAGVRELVLTHLARAGDATAALTAASRHFKIASTTVAVQGTTISAKPLELPPS